MVKNAYQENKELIKPTEVSKKLCVPRSTVYCLLNKDVLPCIDFYGRRMISKDILSVFAKKLEARNSAVSSFRGGMA